MTGHLDYSVRLWDPRTGRILNKVTGLRGFGNSVDFNEEGTKIAAARFWRNPACGTPKPVNFCTD